MACQALLGLPWLLSNAVLTFHREEADLKPCPSIKQRKLKIKGEKVSQIYYDNFHFFPPCFLLACTENVQLNSETFLDILSLELGINVGNI